MKTLYARTAALLALGWALMFVAVALCRPLMPVDETRYLTVAWEMWQTHHYFLPTLNFDPYPHKPPLLFWLINLVWGVTGGPSIWAARVMSFCITAIFVYMTGRLTRAIAPEHDTAGAYAMLTLAAMPMFLIYGSVIMFDTLIGIFVLCGVLTVWTLGQSAHRGWKGWAMLGACIGFGILAKGPVALVYILPPALLAPLWAPQAGHKGKWYGGIFAAVLMGAAIALCWAIPAALYGGADYREKIFITQSAGRMVNAFDHRRPAWFYVGVVAAYLAPFLVWPGLWRDLRGEWKARRGEAHVRFVLSWVVPVFVFFSAISSKQFHYMTPILPGFAVLVALALARGPMPEPKSLVLPMAAMLLPTLAMIGYEVMHKPFMGITLPETAEHYGYVHIAIAIAIFAWARKRPQFTMHALAAASLAMAVMLHVQMGQRFLPRYDIAPMAAHFDAYRNLPVAVAPKYDGEYGFQLRLTKPIDSIGREEIDSWLSQHPDGVIISRYDTDRMPQGYDIVYSQPFRNNETLVLMRRLVMVGSR
jgi:4-amino-4-deoxy-L-arabinose transferase-like glycosyltransferase